MWTIYWVGVIISWFVETVIIIKLLKEDGSWFDNDEPVTYMEALSASVLGLIASLLWFISLPAGLVSVFAMKVLNRKSSRL